MNNNDYKEYGFAEGVPFKGHGPCDCGETKELIMEAFNEIMQTNERNDNRLACHINCAKNQIIEEIHTHAVDHCTLHHLATKDDVRKAVEEVNIHTDEKFDEVDFEGQLSDLNEQVRTLIGRF